jgi:hypothetical protein
MVTKTGRVVSIDSRESSGLIVDQKGREYIFTQWECKDDLLPYVGSEVSFIKDDAWETINVAIDVVPLGN